MPRKPRKRPESVPNWRTAPAPKGAVYVCLGTPWLPNPNLKATNVVVQDGVYLFASVELARLWMLEAIEAAGWERSDKGLEHFQECLEPSEYFHEIDCYSAVRSLTPPDDLIER